MITLAYNYSESLQHLVQRIEELRREILLAPLPPKIELKLRWETNIARIHWGLSIIDNPLTKRDVAKILSSPNPKRLNTFQKEAVNQNNTLLFIKENYLVTRNPLSLSMIKKIYSILAGSNSKTSITEYSEKQLLTVLDYLNAATDHPVIQAGIAQLQINSIAPFDSANARLSRIINYLFLYKYGYDFRGLVVLDEYFRHDLVSYRQAIETSEKNKNMTVWLEYFCQGVILELEKTAEAVKTQRFQTELPSTYWSLNDRQKQILTFLENPTAKISNRQVQGMFKISQITASRDLAKLTSLGLLFSRGKGRSVYYTKV